MDNDSNKKIVSDKDGHYDIDGGTLSLKPDLIKNQKPIIKKFEHLSEQTLNEVQIKADFNSIIQKNQKDVPQDGVPSKDLSPLRTAQYSHGYQDYIDYEKGGD